MTALRLVEHDGPIGPAVTGPDVIEDVVALLADRIPRMAADDRSLAALRDLHDVLAVGLPRLRRQGP